MRSRTTVDLWLEENTVHCGVGRVSERSCRSLSMRPPFPGALIADAWNVHGPFRPPQCDRCAGWEDLNAGAQKFDVGVGICDSCGERKLIYVRGMCRHCWDTKLAELPFESEDELRSQYLTAQWKKNILSIVPYAADVPEDTHFAEWLRHKLLTIRYLAGVSAAGFAQTVGCSRCHVTRIERGIERPSINHLQKILDKFNGIARRVFDGSAGLEALPESILGSKACIQYCQIRRPRNEDVEAELLIGWENIGQFVGLSERRMRELKPELLDGEYIFQIRGTPGKCRIGGWTSDLAKWSARHKEGNPSTFQVALQESKEGGGKLLVGWRQIAEAANLSQKTIRRYKRELLEASFYFRPTTGRGRSVICGRRSDLTEWMKLREMKSKTR